ncbi:MAG: phosphoglucosamine mutase [Bacteroidales bacterium]
MTLIKSISGIRGTIGGKQGDCLTPPDIIKFTAGYGSWVKKHNQGRLRVVVGRDGRTTGEMVSNLVVNTLRMIGIDVTDLGHSTTPTVEVAVSGTGANGGIILTASHNPANWNALKLLNSNGEFLSASDGEEVLFLAESGNIEYSTHDSCGTYTRDDTWNRKHIDLIAGLDTVDTDLIRKAGFNVVVDCINSVGGLIIPELLERLGVKKVTLLNGKPDGNFAHNPEPLAEHLDGIMNAVKEIGADIGFVVDPDVDRLAFISEDGKMFGEEYTLVAISDYILSKVKGSTVSNMSSSRALKDVTEKHGCTYYSSAVGEVNVVEEMKRRSAVIGGEGNGGVIYPALHYGRDALAGIALFLTLMAEKGISCSSLRSTYPSYVMSKRKVTLVAGTDTDKLLVSVKDHFRNEKIDDRDGIRIDFDHGWVHIRKSNTEPILRIYSEGRSEEEADRYADIISDYVKKH